MFEEILATVPSSLMKRSGSVLYSGREAFSSPNSLYILGHSPGGCPVRQASETVEVDVAESLVRAQANWSAYRDESWEGKAPGVHGMQPRVLHMLNSLGMDPGKVPASNLVFVRSGSEAGLGDEMQSLVMKCWPLHEKVIQALGVKTIVCFGGAVGAIVRKKVGAECLADTFVEQNARGWTSTYHSGKLKVVTVTHPSRAAWTNPASDPTPLVKKALADR